ncbi:TonB-dependent receptor plug domain-containing protein, partial [Pseudoalteromonas sp. TB64]|uniref:TonB-dependent receptor plug domain-containing protein n=1 Tax=Pseudoalteromonas sp. TB64 TaxID=1938600 RepID=UPI0004A63FD9
MNPLAKSKYQLNKITLCLVSALGITALPTVAEQSSQTELDETAIPSRTATKKVKDEDVEIISIVGSMIKGATITGALPVSIIDSKDIDAIGATSGSELFASIPSNGTVSFNGNDVVSGVYASRGDVASINLRSIGTGNTLVLLNGRRLVQHPGSQTENSVPVTTVNMNSIPVMGIGAVEVLHDGAAAIYGSDAVAGVVNTQMRKDYSG